MLRRISLIIVMSVAACGGSQKALRVDDSRLVRLSPEMREQLIDEGRDVRVAEQNLEGARVAEKDARDFRAIVENERNAARQALEAARKARELGRRANDASMTQTARDDIAQAEARVRAVDAKMDYADRLVEYRAEVVKQRQAELEAAQAEQEVRKVTQLVAAGDTQGLDQAAFDRAAVDARNRAEKAREKTLRLRGEVEARRSSWQAARGTSTTGVDDAPPPPSALE